MSTTPEKAALAQERRAFIEKNIGILTSKEMASVLGVSLGLVEKNRAALRIGSVSSPTTPVRGPTPLTPAQRARREKERFVYSPESMPWRAQKMLGDVYVPVPVTYRGQRV